MTTLTMPATRFRLPAGSEATAPPERRGVARDGVRLLVAAPGHVEHARFRDLPDHLCQGDLLVVNTSATMPAAIDGVHLGRRVMIHVATALDDSSWVIEARRCDNTGPLGDISAGETIEIPGGMVLEIEDSYPHAGVPGARLWRVTPSREIPLPAYLSDHGRPIRYGYLSGAWPLGDLQNVYADEPGSAEMPSAGRPLTDKILTRLMMRGVVVAPLVLHTGVSSPEKHEPPVPERYRVTAATARLVNDTRAAGGRVVAVGTTVVRALETVARPDGHVEARSGWTDLVIGPGQPVRAVSGLVSGLHEPEASHLLLLEAVAGPELVSRAYQEAVAQQYLWHEFGDSMLFLP